MVRTSVVGGSRNLGRVSICLSGLSEIVGEGGREWRMRGGNSQGTGAAGEFDETPESGTRTYVLMVALAEGDICPGRELSIGVEGAVKVQPSLH